MALRTKERINRGHCRVGEGGTAVGGRRWTLDFSVKEEDMQMTEMIVSGAGVPGSSVDARGTEVMWTDY